MANKTGKENIPQISVNSVVSQLLILYSAAIKKGKPFKDIPSAFLWGPPGVGKSEGIYELAESLEKETGKKVNVTDIRLLLFSPIDLRGVPVADESRLFTDWLKPRIFDLDSSEDVVNIIFLDELSAAPQSVQAAAYQITLDRCVGEHKLPDNTIIMAAGNRTTDHSVAFRMPNALANRLMHFQVAVDYESWRDWALKNGIHPYVTGFIAFNRSMLYAEKIGLEDVAFPTPRSWTFISNILNTLDDSQDVDRLYQMVSGCIGAGIALEFLNYCKSYSYLPSMEKIISGEYTAIPENLDILYAMISSLLSLMKEADKKITDEQLENISNYITEFPIDYAICFFTGILGDNEMMQRLSKIDSFKKWAKRNTPWH